jgi:SPP1 family predicted phage head-tail adaptor
MRSFTSSLRHKVTLEQKVQTADGAGGFTTAWEQVAILWASIDRMRASESYNSGQLRTASSHVFRARYTSSITTDMRLVFGERIFNIRSINNPGEKNNMLEIYAEEGVG